MFEMFEILYTLQLAALRISAATLGSVADALLTLPVVDIMIARP
jgi:hypothetical protein